MRFKRGNRLKLVSEAVATAPVRAIFDEVRHSLGVPLVPMLYQAYATVPDFLEVHWREFKPALETRQFFLLGARLAAECYTRAHSYFDVADLRDDLALPPGFDWNSHPLAQVLDYYQYLDPLLLLITAVQMQAFEAPVGRASGSTDVGRHPNFLNVPRLAGDDDSTSATHRILEERRRLLDLEFVADEHRGMAMWPAFYQQYWLGLKSQMQSPLYADCQYRMAESAWGLAREFPARIETDIPRLLDAGLGSDQISLLARINESLVSSLSGLIVDVTFARIGCEGGTHSDSKAQGISAGAESNRAGSTQAA